MDREKLPKKIKYAVCVLLSVLILWAIVLVARPITLQLSTLQWEHKEADSWQLQRYERRFWHEEAEHYCRQLTLNEHYDWRLPTVDELQDLTQVAAGKRLNLARVERAIYWTATPVHSDNQRYWVFSFLTEQSAPMTQHNYNSVVCVRTVNGVVLD
jgi:hypothetical protein